MYIYIYIHGNVYCYCRCRSHTPIRIWYIISMSVYFFHPFRYLECTSKSQESRSRLGLRGGRIGTAQYRGHDKSMKQQPSVVCHLYHRCMSRWFHGYIMWDHVISIFTGQESLSWMLQAHLWSSINQFESKKTAGPRRQLAVCSAMKDVGVRQLQMQEIYTYSNPKKSQKDRKVTSCSNSGKSWFLSFWRLLYRIVIRYGDGSMDEHPPSWTGKRPIPLRSVFIGL